MLLDSIKASARKNMKREMPLLWIGHWAAPELADGQQNVIRP